MSNRRAAVLIRFLGSGGKFTPEDLSARVTGFSYDDEAGLAADKCTITLDNFDLALFDDPRFHLGGEIEVSWGWNGDMSDVHAMEMVAIKGGTTLSIEAHGGLVRMHREQSRGRTWQNKTRSEIVHDLADEHKWIKEAVIEDTEVKYASIHQPANLSNAEFIKRLAKKERDFVFFMRKGVLHFHSRKYDATPTAEIVYYSGPGAGDVVTWSYDENAKRKKGDRKHAGWNPLTKKPVKGIATNDDTKRPTLAPALPFWSKPINAQSGATTKKLNTPQVPTITRPSTETDPKAIQRQSEGGFVAGRRTITMSVTIIGNPQLLAHHIVKLTGFSQRISGLWYIKKASHALSGDYLTSLELQRDGSNGHANDVKSAGDLNKKKPPTDDRLTKRKVIARDSGSTKYVYKKESE